MAIRKDTLTRDQEMRHGVIGRVGKDLRWGTRLRICC